MFCVYVSVHGGGGGGKNCCIHYYFETLLYCKSLNICRIKISQLNNQSAKGTEMTDSMKTWQISEFL